MARDRSDLPALVDVLTATGLDDALRSDGSFTLIAPGDHALGLVPSPLLDDIAEEALS